MMTLRPHQSNTTSLGQPVRLSEIFNISSFLTLLLSNSPVAAEYLAKGYQLSDQVLQRAIEIDRSSLPISLKHLNSD